MTAMACGAWGQGATPPEGTDAVQAVPAAQAPAAQAPAAAKVGGTIRGTVKSGAVPLPGVGVTATNTLTGKKYATTTDVTGAYAMAIPSNGRYVVKAEMVAFASETKEVVVNAAGLNGGKAEQTAEFGLQLASRVTQPVGSGAEGSGGGGALASRTGGGTARAAGRGVQALSMTSSDTDLLDASAGGGNSGVQMPTLSGVDGSTDSSPGIATDSVAVSGAIGQTNGLGGLNEDDIRQRVQDTIAQAQRQGGNQNDVINAVVGVLGGYMSAGAFVGPGGPGGGGPGGGGGGRGGRGGGGGGGGGGAFRGFNPTQVHGAFAYTGANSALNANSFSVTGHPLPKPDSSVNTFIGSLTGSPYIPGLTKPNPKQFVFISGQLSRKTTPTIQQLIVPTMAQRGGDFSTLGQPIYAPSAGLSVACLSAGVTPGQPFPGNQIPASCISSSGQALLNYYPQPNVAPIGTLDNFQTNTTGTSHSDQISARFNRSFGQAPTRGGRGGFGGGGFGGGRQQQNQNPPKVLRQSIAENFAYSHTAASSQNWSPLLGGNTATNGYSFQSSYTVGYGRLSNTATLGWNRSSSEGLNYFTNTATNPAQVAGVNVGNPTIYSNPFYFGLPSLSLSAASGVGSTGLAGLNDATPSSKVNQTISFSDFAAYRFKKHNVRVGFDYRRIHADSIGGTNVLGAFTFSGFSTLSPAAQNCLPNQGSNPTCTFSPAGSPVADLLLGLPQQTAVTAGLNKIYLRANVMDLYANDDYRVKGNVTLNFGLRWEYFSPYVEKYNRLTNLSTNADFTQISQVCATAAAGCALGSPRSLVNPDRTMFAPRIAVAWAPKSKFTKQTVVRAGYGINYNTTQYASFAGLLAFQQPFAVTQTNTVSTPTSPTGCVFGQVTLANGFNCSTQATQSNYAVNPNYRLGMVQVYSLDIQRTLPQGIVLNVGYTGSHAGDLDMLRAPNRTASGVLNPTANQFTYEDSLGYQRFNGLAVNARKRLQKGISLQATYVYSHSIDNASSIGGGTGSCIGGGAAICAQNDLDLAAEESNSSFDVRQKLSGNWILELPFGPNRAFLNKGGVWAKILDGYSISGTYTFATGMYQTPSFGGTPAEIASGAGNSLRPNLVPGQSIKGQGTVKHWFNTAAFSAPPVGTYGTASRNSVQLPGIVSVNGSLSRTVPLGETRSFEVRVNANNVFNTVQYSGVDTQINSGTFGQVTSAAAMRSLSFVARFRF